MNVTNEFQIADDVRSQIISSLSYSEEPLSRILDSIVDLLLPGCTSNSTLAQDLPIIGALSTLFVEASRFGLSASSFLKFVEAELPSKYNDELVQTFNKLNPDLRKRLYSVGGSNEFPHIVDVKWRLYFRVNKGGSATAKPLYKISLKTLKFGKIDTTEFFCDYKELSDFSAKVREAYKSVESHSHSS